MNKYILIKNDGQPVALNGEIDLKDLRDKLNDNRIFAVQLGNKSLQRNLIAGITLESNITESQNNIVININNLNLYTSSETPEQVITDITTEVNAKAYVLVNDVLFNRNFFISAETLQ